MKIPAIEYAENYNGEGIVLFGASESGKKFLHDFEAQNILCFCDNDPKKWGTGFCGYDVVSPEKLKCMTQPPYIIITSDYMAQIYPQLTEMGFAGKVDWRNLLKIKYFCHINKKNIEKACGMLDDAESERVFRSAIEKRKSITTMYDFSHIKTDEPIYFNSLLECSESEMFVDAGAVGSSSFDFMKWADNKFEKVVCFEPAKEAFDELAREYETRRIPKDKYVLFNLGLYSQSKTVKFICRTASHGNKITDEEIEHKDIISIDVVRLDDVIDKASFIKMDIEGSELAAIKGAERIIKECKPKLAICLYHKITDFWEVPIELKRICPEYRFYVSHHSDIFIDTVLYATI